MATCKDCLHYDVCMIVRHNGDDRVLANSPCKHFLSSADVTVQKHGRWQCVDGDIGYTEVKCSACGKTMVFGEEEEISLYCQYCGAKMDKGA